MEELLEMGYVFVEDKKNSIEFRTSQYMPYVRIKISKVNFEVRKDTRTGQGNKGHISLKLSEINAILDIINSFNK